MRTEDFQPFVDRVGMPCCVMSVQKKPDGSCGEIRIVAANRPYRETMGPRYYDNMIYSELVPQDNKFEDYCFRAAILGQRMHAYVETKAMNCWTDQTLIPLAGGDGSVGYCQFIFEFTRQADADRMSSVSSISIAQAVLSACIRLMSAADFRSGVSNVLEVINEASDARASRVMLVNQEKRRLTNFCEVVVGDSRPNPNTDALTYDLVETWERMLGVSNAVLIKDAQDMALLEQKNPAWVASMRENLVQSLVLIPLRREKQVVGYMYVLNFDVSKIVEVKEMVELISFFLGSEIYNHLLLDKLEELSHIDVLTGLNNRRAMRLRTEAMSRCRTTPEYGVISIDLNGLKLANDRDGHEAGDRLLMRTGELLRRVFRHEDIFRTGGDEFIIISGEALRQSFEGKVRQLREAAEQSGLYLAVGTFWSDGDTDLICALRQADEAMYADKKAFYRKHPEYRR